MIKTIRYWIIKSAGISKGEANALLILIPILIGTIVIPPIIRNHTRDNYSKHASDQTILDSLIAIINAQKSTPISNLSHKKDITYSKFDPNTCTIEALISNGIPKYLAERIVNYRNKGGQFRRKEDLQKIYGFDEALYSSLALYIAIKKHELPDRIEPEYKSRSEKNLVVQPFDINLADTSTLKQIYGIGEKLSVRIVNFRDKVGGFINPSQLHEVYGLKAEIVDSLLSYATISEHFTPIKVNINTDTIQNISSHPYIDYKLAKAIVNYRRQHGNYNQVSELKKIHLIHDSIYHRIAPYVNPNY